MRNLLRYTDNDIDIDEDMKLTRSDYIKILHHYQPASRKMRRGMAAISTKTAKERAHRILADKLCRCIKSPSASSASSRIDEEGRRIAYCTRSIFNTRGLRRHGFRCKNSRGSSRPRLTGDITKTKRKLRL
jgi:hypothetical protein